MNHIMLQCAFSRSFWLQICTALSKPEWTPTQDDTLPSWLVNKGGDGMPARDSRTIIILSLWELWKHRNGIVFAATPRRLIDSLVGSFRRVGLGRRPASYGQTWNPSLDGYIGG